MAWSFEDALSVADKRHEEKLQLKLVQPLMKEREQSERAESVVEMAKNLMQMDDSLGLIQALELARKIRNEESLTDEVKDEKKKMG